MQAILERTLMMASAVTKRHDAFGTKIGLFGSLFGCWHKSFTRPMTSGNMSYRACLDCGARRKFDAKNFKTSRAFYYPPSVTPDRNRTIS